MSIKTVSEHLVDTSLLNKGVCIDVGCRDFSFSQCMRDLGLYVIAVDIENMMPPPGIHFFKYAVWHKDGENLFYNDTNDVQAKHISDKGVPIKAHSLEWFYKLVNGREIDILKLDCESSEYFILSDENFLPIPKQISVEFHLHCHKELHEKYYEKCMENLKKYYHVAKHELTEAHGAGLNYWSSLFIRKDLI